MPRCTCASVPAKISAIPAARQMIVSFSEVNRSTILRSIFLKSHGLNEFYKIRLLFFNRRAWAGRFEKPNAPVAPRPGGECARVRAGDVDGRESCLRRFQLGNLGRDGSFGDWR